ncbi:unnamed protein product [Adineta steineri]|uniref:Cupin type-1 domain-containing protein n=1 Tax=Adineta steineri TaxID=433720 RepID=A0A815E9M1_9BILA|nr:unnamed protein product [Adineta steineri]CAF1566117.1 unnamed protein product [Adineta steineri]
MKLTQLLCFLVILVDVCDSRRRVTTTSTTTTTLPPTTTTTTTLPSTTKTTTTPPPSPSPTTTTTVTTIQALNTSDPLALSRLESIKNSVNELSLLSKTVPSDFIFDFDKAVTGVSLSNGGRTVAATVANFPGLINHGIAMTVGFLGPCGINLPHTHPRATEINFSVDGDFQVGFYQENGATFIMNEVHKNQVAVFPKGAIHFEQNMNCTPATFVAAFNTTVVGASLGGLNISTIEDIRSNLAKNPSLGIEECRKRCNL